MKNQRIQILMLLCFASSVGFAEPMLENMGLGSSDQIGFTTTGIPTVLTLELSTQFGTSENPGKEVVLAAKEDAAQFLQGQLPTPLLHAAMGELKKMKSAANLTDQELAQIVLIVE